MGDQRERGEGVTRNPGQEVDPDEADQAEDAYASAPGADMAPIDFNILVLSMNTSALIQLGEAPDEAGEARVDLPMARHTIDMLAILEDKTRGNLTGAEERLLSQVLFDLRMRYVQKAK
ncbi:MAG: DUF1844 domain-containing protein [Myxococcales bacterium]|jgi:hypothetical protein